jgi:hypothetical protein
VLIPRGQFARRAKAISHCDSPQSEQPPPRM